MVKKTENEHRDKKHFLVHNVLFTVASCTIVLTVFNVCLVLNCCNV